MTTPVNQPRTATGSLRTTGPLSAKAAPAPAKAPLPPPRPRDQNHAQTGKLTEAPLVDIDAVELHGHTQAGKDGSVIVEGALAKVAQSAEAAAGAERSLAAGAATKATRSLGAAGVLTAMTVLVKTLNSRPLKVAAVVSALSDLAANMGTAAAGLSKIPGLDKALHVFGGIGGVVGGIMGLVQNLKDAQKNGLTTSNLLGTMGSACSLVGGLAMALTPFCPPLAVAATAFTLAGAGFNVAKLAYDNRAAIAKSAKAAYAKVTGAASNAVNNVRAMGAQAVSQLAKFERLVSWAR